MLWCLLSVCCLLVAAAAQEEAEFDPDQQITYRARAVRQPYDRRHPQESYGPPQPYSFRYVAPSDLGQHTREESGDSSGRVVGSYTLQDEDGRRRVVEYVADAEGFRANVQTNEPGTDSQNPADVVFVSTYGGGGHGGVGAAVSPPVVRPRPPTRARPPQSAVQIERQQPAAAGYYHPVYHHRSAPLYVPYADTYAR